MRITCTMQMQQIVMIDEGKRRSLLNYCSTQKKLYSQHQNIKQSRADAFLDVGCVTKSPTSKRHNTFLQVRRETNNSKQNGRFAWVADTIHLPKPRAATSVAVIIGLFPALNSAKTQSRSAWLLSPWMESAGHPSIRNCLVTWSQPRFVSMKMRSLLPSMICSRSLINLHNRAIQKHQQFGFVSKFHFHYDTGNKGNEYSDMKDLRVEAVSLVLSGTYLAYFSYSETTSTICSIEWFAFRSCEPIVTCTVSITTEITLAVFPIFPNRASQDKRVVHNHSKNTRGNVQHAREPSNNLQQRMKQPTLHRIRR